jgi:carboxypeptidase Taq
MTESKSAHEIFEQLEAHHREEADLGAALALMGWDQETYMPQGSAMGRACQLKTLSGLAHRHSVDPQVDMWLKKLEESMDDLTPLQQRAVKERRRDYDRSVVLPEELVREMAEQESVAMEAWRLAREKSQFDIFESKLEKLLELKRKVADIWGYETSPYDALHDEFERGSSVEQLKPQFALLRDRLVKLLKKIQESDAQPSAEVFTQEFPEEKQWDFTMKVLDDMGFNFEKGRQDKSTHPFSTSIGEHDSRLTTRLSTTDFRMALGSSMHEGGHGIYEQGISEEAVGSILADSTSLGIHESQSRLWEHLIGSSEAFWNFYFDELVERFPEQFKDATPRQLYESWNHVEPSLIRVESDEVTYNLHILIRFEIEVDLIEGKLAVADLPETWNRKYTEYLGVTPSNNAEGCLQDIHWSMGAFGYFPTYTLGNLYSVPFFQAACRDISGLHERLDVAMMHQLRDWLNREIHVVGRSELAGEICERVTGSAMSPNTFCDYLEYKYGDLYGFEPELSDKADEAEEATEEAAPAAS